MATSRGPRVRVAPSIYRDNIGYAVQVAVGTHPHKQRAEKRFPFGTAFEVMRDWRDAVRPKLRRRVPVRPGDATLADDIARYLRGPIALGHPETRAAELRAWVPHVGHRRRETITTLDLERCLVAWRAQGVAAGTCNHRRNALIQLWRALDGVEAPNPAAATTHFREPSGDPREVRTQDLDDLVAAMPPSRTRAFYRLFAETGWPPARIRRMREADVAWSPPAGAYLEDRRKGRGTAGRFFPVSARGLEALREFHEARAYGGVTRSSVKVVFDRARLAVNTRRAAWAVAMAILDPAIDLGDRPVEPAIPDGVRPYDARHTVGAQVYRQTGDIYATAELLGVSVDTALRYTRAAVPDRMRVAADALDAIRGPARANTPLERPLPAKGRVATATTSAKRR